MWTRGSRARAAVQRSAAAELTGAVGLRHGVRLVPRMRRGRTDEVSLRDFLENLFPDVYEGNEEHRGHFCLKMNPEKCPCGHVIKFFEPAEYHLIVVWKEKDNEVLLQTAAGAMRLKKNPRIVEYQVAFGPSIEFYEACQEGMFPVE